jgi:V-type H+-transporting ATPase subunit H
VLATLISRSGSVSRTTTTGNLLDGTTSTSAAAPVLTEENIKFVCQWVREQMRKVDEKEQCNGIAALQKILRNESLRVPYAQEDGLHLLGNLLKTKVKNFQIVYQSVQCLWLLSFQKSVAEQIAQTRIIHNLVEILKVVPKEKVIRMTLATLRNLLGVGSNNDLMIDSGILKPLEVLTAKSWGDEDIVDDLTALNDALQKNMVILSSFEMYKKEVLSGNLEWSPVHRSEKFWRENAHRLEEDNNKLLLVLKEILTSASDSQVLCIACFDVGEFARFHPRGKVLIQQTGLKLALMKLMEDKDSEIKKHALLAVQKLMVTNWEYLSA